MNVKTPTAAGSKWSTRASAASQDYANGVANTTTDQAGAAAQAAPVWAQAVQQAAANGTFAKNVLAAGTAKWKAGVASTGATRYTQGVSNASGKYVAGVTPYFNALSSAQLPARQTKGNNAARSQAVVQLLMQTKASM